MYIVKFTPKGSTERERECANQMEVDRYKRAADIDWTKGFYVSEIEINGSTQSSSLHIEAALGAMESFFTIDRVSHMSLFDQTVAETRIARIRNMIELTAATERNT